MKTIEKLRHARRAGVPLVSIGTPDPAATIGMVESRLKNGSPMVAYDVQRGILPVNEQGQEAMSFVDLENATEGGPLGFLEECLKLPDKTIVFVHNAAMIAEVAGLPWVQGVYNMRDEFKQNRRTMILLGPDSTPHPLLEGHVEAYEEELPTPAELKSIVRAIDESACESIEGRPKADEETLRRAVDAIQGLMAFSAEQAVAMAVREDGFDLNHLWEVKRTMIEQTPGLSVWRGGETFDDIKGLQNSKDYCTRLIEGRKKYGCIVFIDEIEKLLAGAEGDTSGVSKGFLQVFLTYMNDNEVDGMIFVGHPGGGKSMLAKAIGGEAGVPTLAFDTNEMKNSLVGSSEQRIRQAMKVVTAVSNGRPLFVATCNSIATLPTELRRRFTKGTFFFDLPTKEERDSIWDHYLDKYGLENTPRPNDKDWTGAEIKACCQSSWQCQMTLKEAAEYLVPIAKADPEKVERLRKESAGAYISASEPGVYKLPTKTKAKRSVGGSGDYRNN